MAQAPCRAARWAEDVHSGCSKAPNESASKRLPLGIPGGAEQVRDGVERVDINTQAATQSSALGARDPGKVLLQPSRVCLPHDKLPPVGHQAVRDELQRM